MIYIVYHYADCGCCHHAQGIDIEWIGTSKEAAEAALVEAKKPYGDGSKKPDMRLMECEDGATHPSV